MNQRFSASHTRPQELHGRIDRALPVLTRALKTSAPTLLLFAIFAQWAHAHPEGITLSSLRVARDGVRIETVLPDGFIDAMAQQSSIAPPAVISSAYIIYSETGRCSTIRPPRAWRLPDINSTRYVVDYQCQAPPRTSLVVAYTLAGRLDPQGRIHENFMTIPWPEGSQSVVFYEAGQTFALDFSRFRMDEEIPFPQSLEETGILTPDPWDFIILGAKHIAAGFDHIVFLLGLFLLSLSLGAMLAIITAFTFGHSITLGLASLGLYDPAPELIEIGIAVSIIYIGAENIVFLFRRTSSERPENRQKLIRRRWLLAGLFGLIHGFGLSGALRDMGLPENSQIRSLLGFNLGVEAGQLLILAALLPLLTWLWKRMNAKTPSFVLSTGIIVLGCWWLAERVAAGAQ